MILRPAHMAALVVLTAGLTCFADTLASVEKKIVEQTAKCRSVDMTSRQTSQASSAGISMVTQMDNRFECARMPDDKVMSRQESTVKRTIRLAGRPDHTEQGTTLVICDSRYIYVLTHASDQQTATKSRVKSRIEADPFDARSSFEHLHKYYDLKLLPDTTLDGRDTYVIEATLKKGGTAGMFARVVTYYDKQTGLPLKSVSYDEAGKTRQTLVVTAIKANVDIPAKRFIFKTPPGVELLDMTKFESPGTQQAGSAAQPELPDE